MADKQPSELARSKPSGWRDSFRRPTFWVVLLMLAVFLYTQWPTHVRQPETPDYIVTNLPVGVQVQWEAEPTRRAGEAGSVWHLKRKGMEFLIQSGSLDTPLPELAERMMKVDREQVNGAEYEPLSVEGQRARYALYDAENRIQRHRLYGFGERWVKTSVLYKAQSEEREQRALVFLNSVVEQPPTQSKGTHNE